MASVFCVEKGDYSDYQVVAIFSSEELAKAFSAKLPGSSVVERELDAWTEEQVGYRFDFDLAGNMVREEPEAYYDPLPTETDIKNWSWAGEISIKVNRGPRDLALKIATERYYRLRAHMDDARNLVTRAKLGADWNQDLLTVEIAEILAGLTPLQNPPRSGNEETILKILGVAPQK